MNAIALINKAAKPLAKVATSKAFIIGKKYLPDALMIIGSAMVVGGTVKACKDTYEHLDEIISEKNEILEYVNEAKENGKTTAGEEYTEEDYKKDMCAVYTKTAKDLVKLYGTDFLMISSGIGMIFMGNGIIKSRLAQAVTAYNAERAFNRDYRKRVADEVGVEKEKDIYAGIKEEKAVVEGEDGKKTKKAVKTFREGTRYSQYAKFFDEGSDCWDKDAERNLYFIRTQEKYANDILDSRGHLFLNEVYDSLGLPRTKAGQQVGWVKNNPDGDGYVSFGIFDGYLADSQEVRDFINCRERSVLLDFNVDGNILDIF